MSSTNIPTPIKLLAFGRAAGRCEYRGCNKELTQDDLTKRPANLSAFAHIVADEPGGPRGDIALSPLLAKEISNLMVLCLDHHRMVDDPVNVKGHPVDLLMTMKAEHEDRVRRLTAIDGQHKTHMVFMEANIGPRKGLISAAQARQAVLPHYPVDEGTWIDLARLNIEDGRAIAWAVGMEDIDAAVATVIRPNVQRGLAKHVSVFALAPIPLLMYLGRAIGDISSGVAYQRHRATEDWLWRDPAPSDQPIQIERPKDARGEHVAIRMSFSGKVHGVEVLRAAPDVGDCQYEIGVAEPRTDCIRTRVQLAQFSALARGLLAEIRGRHGPRVTIHVFPAVPNSIAVEFGKCLLPKADPLIEVYDLNWRLGAFNHALTLIPGQR